MTTNKSYNITGNGVTTLNGRLLLVSLIIGTKGASSNTITVYNDSEATPEKKIGKFDTTANPGVIELNIPCLNGIHLVTESGTAPDVTVVYQEMA